MTDKKEIQCEYCTVRSNEKKCKALEIEFHNCLNILEQKKCPIYKLKQQLQEKEKECEELKQWKKDAANLFKTQTDNADKIISRYKQALEPFKDDYFKNLDTKTIAELAKKSIRLTTENRKFKYALIEIEKQCKCYARSTYTQEFDRKYGGNLDTNILEIIEDAEGSGENGDT